ncbi:hypothetical protein [Agarivorans aestuarii]|uniref:hypothetical protein n=1 Tax=Agarivorans aestuarii TaxID=1563703 RepID=UPI001C7E4BAB|nr:hypothetical protein [Agarivorans aestuarii]
MSRTPLLMAVTFFLISCTAFNKSLQNQQMPHTQAEAINSYSYVPLEPLPIDYSFKCDDAASGKGLQAKSCNEQFLALLPDNSIRISTRQTNYKLGVNANIAPVGMGIGLEGNSYQIVIDYLNSVTGAVGFYGKWIIDVPETTYTRNRCYPYQRRIGHAHLVDAGEIWTLLVVVAKEKETKNIFIEEYPNDNLTHTDYNCGTKLSWTGEGFTEIIHPKETDSLSKYVVTPTQFNIPIYVGIGVRLTANINVLKGQVDLGSLSALSIAAEAGSISGNMSVQTLGINGESIRSSLLFISKIDGTTIQNAIQSMASIKADINKDSTILTPRILGYQNLVGAEGNGIRQISSLLSHSPDVLGEGVSELQQFNDCSPNGLSE